MIISNAAINSSSLKVKHACCIGNKLKEVSNRAKGTAKESYYRVSHLFEESRTHLKPYSKSDPEELTSQQMKMQYTTRSFILASAASNDSLYFFCFCLNVAKPLTSSTPNLPSTNFEWTLHVSLSKRKSLQEYTSETIWEQSDLMLRNMMGGDSEHSWTRPFVLAPVSQLNLMINNTDASTIPKQTWDTLGAMAKRFSPKGAWEVPFVMFGFYYKNGFTSHQILDAPVMDTL